MTRPKGALGRTDPKNRALNLRVTAREYAQVIQIARYTNHTVSVIVRKFVRDGLKEHAEMLKTLSVGQEEGIAKRVFRGSSSSSSRSRRWARAPDKLYPNLSAADEEAKT